MAQFFPQGVVTDEAFCNRDVERAILANKIFMHEHTVLVAPRRYGKTSLITQVLRESRFPGERIDLFFVLSHDEVLKAITSAASRLVSALLPKTKSTTKKIIDAINRLNPRLTFGLLGQKLEITFKQHNEQSISELLLALDAFAAKTQQKAVIVFDEFQQVGELSNSHSIEAAIRHAVELSQNITYIFCGSERHLLNEMFSDKSRPLYHLCELMKIGRIPSSCYAKFLNKMAQQRWFKPLDDQVIAEIIQLTENHPYYVNVICRRLWHTNKLPTVTIVREIWDDYVNQQSDWIINDLSALTLNQRKLVAALADQSTDAPHSQAFCLRAGLLPANVQRSLESLKRLDFIDQNDQGAYKVLDPAVAYFIQQRQI